jgi:FKBP-type peptidyl-prolyl cis-trans isomerase
MNKNVRTGIAIGVAVFVVALLFVFMNPFNNPSGSAASASATTPAAPTAQLIVQDETVGTGAVAATGDLVTVDYTGKFQDGTVFDTSVGKKPIQFVLGAGQVIPGWDQGLQGMKAGGKRLLVIPPDLGYGAQAVGPIPANSTLVFEVQLVSVTAPPAGTKQQ